MRILWGIGLLINGSFAAVGITDPEWPRYILALNSAAVAVCIAGIIK